MAIVQWTNSTAVISPDTWKVTDECPKFQVPYAPCYYWSSFLKLKSAVLEDTRRPQMLAYCTGVMGLWWNKYFLRKCLMNSWTVHSGNLLT